MNNVGWILNWFRSRIQRGRAGMQRALRKGYRTVASGRSAGKAQQV